MNFLDTAATESRQGSPVQGPSPRHSNRNSRQTPLFFDAKYGLLTYAQCGSLDPKRVAEHIEHLGGQCIIGRESHADGGLHLHAFFMFERKFRTRACRVFDVDGRHPNVVRGYGSPEKGYDYATKDGAILWPDNLRDRAEGAMIDMMENGRLSSWRTVELNFIAYARNWTLEHFAVHSGISRNTPTGNIDQTLLNTRLPKCYAGHVKSTMDR